MIKLLFIAVVGFLLIVVLLVWLGERILANRFKGLVQSGFEKYPLQEGDLISETDIAHLPAIVQKYLHLTKSVGKPKIVNFNAVFKGGMRANPGDPYMLMRTVQYNFIEEPARYFWFSASKSGLPLTGMHIYRSSGAVFKVLLLNWFPIIKASGDQLKQAETVTVLNDGCFIAPGTLIDSRISWETISETKVRAFFTNPPFSISAELCFTTAGALINFISTDRFETDGKQYNNYPWFTPVSDYREFNGYLLPGKAELWYDRPGGKFKYGELDLLEVRYNLAKRQTHV